ncbi:C40 family peptidase [Marinobacter sp.]|uniref:C40 family peptidase n=1 Tax=Marinobacter sp. TaxID=50741 RepID=UPI003566E565
MPKPHQIPVRPTPCVTRNILLLVLALVLTGCASSPQVADRQQSPVPVYGAPVESDNERVSKLQDVLDRYEGTPYRYGGTTPRGFDCSGFIGQAYQEAFGMEVPRTTSAMLSHGTPVSPQELEPGDVVFFNIRGKEQHAGIFIGGDDFIHASTSVGVTRSSLNGYYWRDRFTQARRFD